MLLSLLLLIIIACVHIFANKISMLDTLPRRKWLSFAGGISVAFVFLHILPQLQDLQDSIGNVRLLPAFIEHDLYMMAMGGILLFYGLEQFVINIQKRRDADEEAVIENDIFWFHIGAFALFNCIIGYYLHLELEADRISAILTYSALGFHFLVNDYALLQHHEKQYHDTGRWIMASAVVAGWIVGAVFVIPEIVSSIMFALLAGAIIINSFKEELPEEKESDFVFFLTGVIIYSVLLIL